MRKIRCLEAAAFTRLRALRLTKFFRLGVVGHANTFGNGRCQ